MKVFGKKILSAITVSMAIALMSCSTPAADYAAGKVYHYNSELKTATFWLRSPAPDGLNNTTKDSKWIRCVSPVGTLYNSFNEDRSIEGLVPAFCMEL